MKDKIVLVTGANAGIGKSTALGLAKLNAEVIMLSRNEQKGERAKKEVIRASGNNRIHLMICDLSLQKDIRKFAENFKNKFDRLDVLVSNAAVVYPERKETEEGMEQQLAVNHLAPFLLINLLSDYLLKSSSSRIVVVASQVHANMGIRFNDLQSENEYNSSRVYAMTKLANVLFTFKLAEKLEGTKVTANTLHPGVIATKLLADLKNNPLKKIAQKFLYDKPEKGAETSIYLASSPEVDGVSGKYFADKKISTSSMASLDKELQQKLWEASVELINLKPSESEWI